MKKVGLWASLLAVSLSSAIGQVAVEVTLTQDQFLPGEALPVTVRVSNRSGQTLQLGADEDWLTFSIESQQGVVVSKIGEVPVVGAFVVNSSERAVKRADLEPYFLLTQSGRYSIVATVKLKAWNQQVASLPVSFNLIEGSRLWEQEFGVPLTTSQTNPVPEIRKYILQEVNYVKGGLKLYLRVTDGSGIRPIRTMPVGNLLSFSRPEHQLDKNSNLHLLYQSWAHSFSYTVFSPDGEPLTRETYEYVDARPRLTADETGNISVAGGVRRVSANEAAPPTVSRDEIQTPKR